MMTIVHQLISFSTFCILFAERTSRTMDKETHSIFLCMTYKNALGISEDFRKHS